MQAIDTIFNINPLNGDGIKKTMGQFKDNVDGCQTLNKEN